LCISGAEFSININRHFFFKIVLEYFSVKKKFVLKSFVPFFHPNILSYFIKVPQKHIFRHKGSTDVLKPTALDFHYFETLLNQDAGSAARDTGLPTYIWYPESVCRTLRKDIKDICLETHT
jgi:hypothetical protein